MAGRLPLRILVVEDNQVNRDLLLRILERLGYQADIASNGREALTALSQQTYDIILMDVQMPMMDGLAATRSIRCELPPERQPRIIAVTANVVPGEREECLKAGMDDYVSKPVEVLRLVEALERGALATTSAPVTPVVELPSSQAVPVPADVAPVLNATAVRRLYASLGRQAGTILPTLIQTFFSSVAQLQTNARTALALGQVSELQRAAHTLKSNGETFGATHFAQLCRTLEHHARDGVLDGAEDLLAQIEQEYARVQGALDELAAELYTG